MDKRDYGNIKRLVTRIGNEAENPEDMVKLIKSELDALEEFENAFPFTENSQVFLYDHSVIGGLGEGDYVLVGCVREKQKRIAEIGLLQNMCNIDIIVSKYIALSPDEALNITL